MLINPPSADSNMLESLDTDSKSGFGGSGGRPGPACMAINLAFCNDVIKTALATLTYLALTFVRVNATTRTLPTVGKVFIDNPFMVYK